MNADRERQELLELFYQCPIGLLQIDDRCTVQKINPAAARMLASMLAGENATDLSELLRLLAPELTDLIEARPDILGRLGDGYRVAVAPGGPGQAWFEMTAVRLGADRVMIVLVDVTAERRAVEREHQIALDLQMSMLGRIDTVPSVPVGVTYRAAELGREVGGDWYDAVRLPGDRIGLIVGDVAGHNIAATAAMGQLRSAVRALAPSCADAATLLGHADGLAAHIGGADCATMAYLIFDPATGAIDYACAGHPPPLVIAEAGGVFFLSEGRGMPLAHSAGRERSGARDQLAPGDTLVMYTDGLYERRDELQDPRERLRLVAAALRGRATTELGDELVAAMLGGRPPIDDICVLVVRHAPQAGRRRPATSRRAAWPSPARTPRR